MPEQTKGHAVRFMVVPAVYVVLRDGDKVLLLQRANTGYYDGYYALPAGHVDGGEPAKAAAIREVNEEVGVTINLADLQFVHVMHRVAEEGNHERVDFFFMTTKWQGTPRNAEPHKCDDVQWFPIDDLPENISPVSALALQQIMAGTTYSDHDFS